MIKLKGQKVLVVGGAGFVGSNLVLKLLECGPNEILIVDNLLSSEITNVPEHSSIRFVEGSITDDNILSALPDDLAYVFHLACFHGNQSSIADPISDHANNAYTSLKLFERLKHAKNLKKVVYASAGCAVAEKTFGEARATPEDAPVSLFHDSPYSISKLIGEMYGNYYFQHDQLPFVKARFQNVYGPREVLGAGRWRGTPHTIWRNVIPVFIWKALRQEALPLDNNGRGSRDFIYVEDLIVGLLACAEKGRPGEAYNIASGIETTIFELSELINDITENPVPAEMKPPRDWDRSGKRFGTTGKALQSLQFKAVTQIREGIAKTVDWTRGNHQTIERAITKHEAYIS